ncbi:hypothetical protein S7711_09477 [Stachybotrys chartarum IBT 7711]|uniref:Sialidase n=1 Tax=Stachybotrys chartarum (strain CBS 109288 / IBT 7711) TaxID=1280523 RepID=A0A084APW8_STACB|nr:hypothetical protein S7711_09477 [Stachybotrys chartarum IBT 7711]KFA47647.1 hypothetical protein S40293_07650 [Stachybotrys chartarum IBT 40293]KFA75054.1 hypothetical protein S40288_06564 [Stachybotrys chartarum IBT 40288]
MSALEADFNFDFNFPFTSIEQPTTPPNMGYAPFDTSLLDIPFNPGHARSSSRGSVYSAVSTVESTPESVCTHMTTPSRDSPPIRQHGPLLLPKIRSQDQDVDSTAVTRHVNFQSATPPPSRHLLTNKALRASHARSFTNPEALNNMAYAHLSFSSQFEDQEPTPSLLCSPAPFFQDPSHNRRASSIDAATIGRYGYPTYRQMPFVPVVQPDFTFPSYSPRAPSPLSMAPTPEPTPSTSLMAFLTAPNPAASLVRTISFPLRDPNTKHFWWDIRGVRPWTSFNASTIMKLPGAAALLTTQVPAPLLPQPNMTSRHPDTEAALHGIYASYYLPKLNSALSLACNKPLQFSVSASKTPGMSDPIFVANAVGDSATAAAMFGGKPTARVVGLVRSFDRFNTTMRKDGNIKRVEYLRGLAALHHAMREHGCRYGFILTEIELVIVRNGTESTPFFGDLEVTSVQLVVAAPDAEFSQDISQVPLTACLALWGLCQIAGDHPPAGHAHWKAEIGAPAEGTRRKAKPRESWIPQPQLAEKREAKRARGWMWPEDAIGRKELGKRGVKYGNI